MDSDLEAFSHNPTHGSFTPTAKRLALLAPVCLRLALAPWPQAGQHLLRLMVGWLAHPLR
jgi:hypothetical protein